MDAIHAAQGRSPIREVWDPALRLPKRLIEYVCAICEDFPAYVRQEAVLLLKRYIWVALGGGGPDPLDRERPTPNLQVIALACVHLSMKHWHQRGLAEQKLHWLSRNAFTRRDFIDAEAEVMRVLGCNVHWEGVLLAEWAALLLHLASPLMAEVEVWPPTLQMSSPFRTS